MTIHGANTTTESEYLIESFYEPVQLIFDYKSLLLV